MRFTQKLLITVAALCITASLSAQKDDVTLYFTVDEMGCIKFVILRCRT